MYLPKHDMARLKLEYDMRRVRRERLLRIPLPERPRRTWLSRLRKDRVDTNPGPCPAPVAKAA